MIFNDDHASLLRSHQFIDWLDEQVGSSETHYLQDLYRRRMVAAEMVAAETYHALARFLEAYPQVASVRPLWFPEIDSDDRNMVIRFRLDIESRDPADQADREERAQRAQLRGDPVLAFNGYEEYPPSIEAMDVGAYDNLVEMAEGVGPELWNEFTPFTLSNPKREPYASQAEVLADMNEDLSGFLAKLQQWLLEHGTAKPQESMSRQPKTRL